MSLTKYQIKDKFIKDVSRYYILEESKEKITPNKIYIRK
jgi:hypothetical protein